MERKMVSWGGRAKAKAAPAKRSPIGHAFAQVMNIDFDSFCELLLRLSLTLRSRLNKYAPPAAALSYLFSHMFDSVTGGHLLRHAYGKKIFKSGEREAAKHFISAVMHLWDTKSHCDFMKNLD